MHDVEVTEAQHVINGNANNASWDKIWECFESSVPTAVILELQLLSLSVWLRIVTNETSYTCICMLMQGLIPYNCQSQQYVDHATA